MKRRILAVSLLTLFSARFSYSGELTMADALDTMAFMNLQLSAVTIDMAKYIGWFPDDKEAMKEASRKARGDLEILKNSLMDIDLPGEADGLKTTILCLVDRIRDIYEGIENKSAEELEKSFKGFNADYSPFMKEFDKALNKHKKGVELPKSFDPLDEEVKLVPNEEDRALYRNAVNNIQAREYEEAYEALCGLRDGYAGTPFEGCLLVKMSDCLLMADSKLASKKGLAGDEEGVRLLSQAIDSGLYSPVLCEAFLKWRTMTQFSLYGASNMSEIPNQEYNKKRWEIIQAIKRYLRENQGDRWARRQADDLLLGLANIERGGLMGNANIMYWCGIYTDVGEEK